MQNSHSGSYSGSYSDKGSDRGQGSRRGGGSYKNDSEKTNVPQKSGGKGKYRSEFSGDHKFEYKDPVSLVRFVGDGGKITPARISKLSIAQQKDLAGAVKKARSLSLLPNGMDAFDGFMKSESISPIPFEY